MGQGRPIKTMISQILLIALAVQGITADPEDIASINALRFLWMVPAGIRHR